MPPRRGQDAAPKRTRREAFSSEEGPQRHAHNRPGRSSEPMVPGARQRPQAVGTTARAIAPRHVSNPTRPNVSTPSRGPPWDRRLSADRRSTSNPITQSFEPGPFRQVRLAKRGDGESEGRLPIPPREPLGKEPISDSETSDPIEGPYRPSLPIQMYSKKVAEYRRGLKIKRLANNCAPLRRSKSAESGNRKSRSAHRPTITTRRGVSTSNLPGSKSKAKTSINEEEDASGSGTLDLYQADVDNEESSQTSDDELQEEVSDADAPYNDENSADSGQESDGEESEYNSDGEGCSEDVLQENLQQSPTLIEIKQRSCNALLKKIMDWCLVPQNEDAYPVELNPKSKHGRKRRKPVKARASNLKMSMLKGRRLFRFIPDGKKDRASGKTTVTVTAETVYEPLNLNEATPLSNMLLWEAKQIPIVLHKDLNRNIVRSVRIKQRGFKSNKRIMLIPNTWTTENFLSGKLEPRPCMPPAHEQNWLKQEQEDLTGARGNRSQEDIERGGSQRMTVSLPSEASSASVSSDFSSHPDEKSFSQSKDTSIAERLIVERGIQPDAAGTSKLRELLLPLQLENAAARARQSVGRTLMAGQEPVASQTTGPTSLRTVVFQDPDVIRAMDKRLRCGDTTLNDQCPTGDNQSSAQRMRRWIKHDGLHNPFNRVANSEADVISLVSNLITGLFEGCDKIAEDRDKLLKHPSSLTLFKMRHKPDCSAFLSNLKDGEKKFFGPCLCFAEAKPSWKASEDDVRAQMAAYAISALSVLIVVYLTTRKSDDEPMPSWMWVYGVLYTETGFTIFAYYPEVIEVDGELRWGYVALEMSKKWKNVWMADSSLEARMAAHSATLEMRSHTQFLQEQLCRWANSSPILTQEIVSILRQALHEVPEEA